MTTYATIQLLVGRLTLALTSGAGRLNPPLPRGDRGSSLTEYALLVSLIALACLAALQFFGASSGNSVNRSSTSIINAG